VRRIMGWLNRQKPPDRETKRLFPYR